MQTASARIWRESTRWAIRIEIDGAPYTERDYADILSATAIAAILRNRGLRLEDLDEDECDECDEPLDLATCSQCGVDAFVRTCGHGAGRPIRETQRALYCRRCRP
jgi:hypothetical protein